MKTAEQIYREDSALYHQLVSCEDYQNNLQRTLLSVFDFAGKTIFESGGGSGRITLPLAKHCKRVVAADISHHMVHFAQHMLAQQQVLNVDLLVADHRYLPMPAGHFDAVVVGWSLCYLATTDTADWRDVVQKTIGEFERLLAADGVLILVETLGTGSSEPDPPESMRPYLNLLRHLDFQEKQIRTDYQFESVTQAADLTEFFWGASKERQLLSKSPCLLPECTSVLWRQLRNPQAQG